MILALNPAHLHLVTTHVPVFGAAFGLGLFLVASIQRNATLLQTSLWTFVLTAVAVVPTYLSGSPAHTFLMKAVSGLLADQSDQHAEVAVIALTIALVLGAFAAAGLIRYRGSKRYPGWFVTLIVTLAILVAGSLIWTASLGGRIRHPEIQVK